MKIVSLVRSDFCRVVALVLAALFVGPLSASLCAQQTADIILHNEKILTVDENFSTAQAVAIRGNQIAAVGQNAQILQMAGPSTAVVNLNKAARRGLLAKQASVPW